MAKTINDNATKGKAESTNYYGNFKESVEKLVNSRFKNDPKKAEAEINKLMKKFGENALEIQQYERKSKKELMKEENDYKRAIAKMEMASAKTNGQYMKASFKEAAANFSDYLNEKLSLSAFVSNIGSLIDNYASTYSKYSAAINARLQTFENYQGEAFKDLSSLVRKNLAASPYMKQEEMLESLNKLVGAGISYNLEQRAFLETIGDKIVTTFETLDKTLLSMIRLQQQDTTQARMGMEAYLTKYLNSTYEDSSYLNDVYDIVTQNLFEASSQVGRNASVELEYVVQKWLGSMYSVGVGSEFLSKVSQGLGYLGSGDIESLQGNAALQNLLVMAANRSGVEYSQILSQGLNAATANKLLQGITSYVHDISNPNNNQVVRAQYANLFGLSLSDMTAMLNITTEEIGSIAENMLTYDEMTAELNSQLAAVGSRMHVSELYDNIMDNFMTGVAGNIASNAGSYITWKVVDIIEQATGGIAIPTISVMGNMIDLETTVTGLIKTGMVGASTLGQIGAILAGLSNGGSLNLNTWGGNESTARGSGFGAITSGYSKTTSTSAYIGSSSGSDIYSSSVTAAKDQAKEENKGSEDTKSDAQLILELLQAWRDTHVNVNVTNTTPIPVQNSNYGLIM